MERSRKRDSSATEGVGELTRQLERLQRDLGRRERELEEERKETERTIDRLRGLEKDKIELKRELDEVRDEVTEYQRLVDELREEQIQLRGDQQQRGEDEDGRISSLRATLQERNREIGHFIQDLEKIQDEKDILKQKLSEVGGALHEATTQITDLTKDRHDLRSRLESLESLVSNLQEEKAVLEIRESELLAFKEQNELQLENLGTAVDIRVDVWKKMMYQKEEEIERLNGKVTGLVRQLQGDSRTETVQQLKSKVKERENQIHLLTSKLREATDELNFNTKTLQDLQKSILGDSLPENENEAAKILQSYEKKVRKLEGKIEKRNLAVETAEKDAEEKTKEIVHLAARLREYEAGHYGMAEAVAEVKTLRNQIRLRDKDLEKLTQDINQFQVEGSDLVEENEMLRKKLGYNQTDDLSQDRKLFGLKREEELNSLRTKIEIMDNEITTLKTRNYELKKQLSHAEERNRQIVPIITESLAKEIEYPLIPVIPAIVDGSNEWRQKYDIILHENTELRRGLQEILDSFQRLTDDDSSSIRIESPILENLLREMSARGLINYPYSISSFHLKVCNLEGKNSQLREELQRTRAWAEGLLEKEKQRTEEWRGKAMAAQDLLNQKNQNRIDPAIEERLKESQQETARWRRINEQSEKMISVLNQSKDEAEAKIADLEDRIERTAVKENLPVRCQSEPEKLITCSIGNQTEPIEAEILTAEDEFRKKLESRLREVEELLTAKDDVIENLQVLASSHSQSISIKPTPKLKSPRSEFVESLELAQETIQSMTERLQAKDKNLTSYKVLLAEVRGEMQRETERHVQDMNALQSTIHHQQQAFIRMKSTLSHPVRDSQTSDIEGVIREQLTRINELEECVRDLEHTLGNVASQLAAARSDAHRWKTTADSQHKEVDLLREQLGEGHAEEVDSLRGKLRDQDVKIVELKRLHDSSALLKELLEQRELELQILRSNASSASHVLPTVSGKILTNEDRSGEIEHLRKSNTELQTKINKLQVRLSKLNATNRATGISQEMEELRQNYEAVLQQRSLLQTRISELERSQREDEEKKQKQIEGYARWEESKKWKKVVERLESQKRDSEEEKSKLTKQVESMRILMSRLEKEKALTETRFRRGLKSSASEQSLSGEGIGSTIEKLRHDNADLKLRLDQTESVTSEEIERLTLEARILRERIQTQERQLTSYQITHKGDPKVVTEIEKLVKAREKFQEDLIEFEQENTDLKVQLQEMKLEVPRLRDRVQHLQKLVDVLKSDRSTSSFRSTSGRSLSELEKTITALRGVIDKLQPPSESRRGPQIRLSKSNIRSRQTTDLMNEKEKLLDRIQGLEEQKESSHLQQQGLQAQLGELRQERDDAQSRAQSAEMRLGTFLKQEEEGLGPSPQLLHRIKFLEKELERKSNLLDDAKKVIEGFAKTKKS